MASAGYVLFIHAFPISFSIQTSKNCASLSGLLCFAKRLSFVSCPLVSELDALFDKNDQARQHFLKPRGIAQALDAEDHLQVSIFPDCLQSILGSL